MVPADNRQMRGLWRHLLHDSISRGWFFLAGAGFLFLMFFKVETSLALAFDYMPEGSVLDAIMPAFFLLMCGFAYAAFQYPSYPLLAVLPMSRNARGRWVWFHHLAVMPAFYYGVMALVAMLAPTIYGVDWHVAGYVLHPVFVSVILIALASPALELLVRNRPPLYTPWQSQIVFYAPIGALAGWSYVKVKVDAIIPPPYLFTLAAASVAVLALSYIRAPRLVVGPRFKTETARRFSRGHSVSSPVRPGTLGPLWQMVLLEPFRGWPLVLVLFMSLLTMEYSWDFVISRLAGLLTFCGFLYGGQLAAERARLMRTVPVTAATIATAVMGLGLISSSYAALLGVLFVAAGFRGISLTELAGTLLLGTCLGSFMPVLYTRYSRWSRVWACAAIVVLPLTIGSISFRWAEQLWLLPPLAITAPLCVFGSTLLLRKALLYETAFQYRKPLLQAMREG